MKRYKYEIINSLHFFIICFPKPYSSDYSNSCRICLLQLEPLKSLLNAFLNVESYADVFMNCTGINIAEKPEHPDFICYKCDEKLMEFNIFRTKCIESDEILTEILKNSSEIIEVPETSNIENCEIIEETDNDSDFEPNDDSEELEDEETDSEKVPSIKIDTKCEEICKVCEKPLPVTKKALNKHISTHDPGNPIPFICRLCSKGFKTARSLYNHEKAHVPNSKCSFCDEKFRTYISRVYHERKVHTGIKPYSCKICENKTFFTKAEINKHNYRHHTTVKPYVCEICSKGYVLLPEFKQHLKVHKNERDYQCTICGKSFLSSASVRIHEKQVHITEDRFSCEKCSINFSKKPALWKHNRTVHEGDNFCDFCGKCFMTRELLKKHTQYHEDDLKYQCPVCPNKKFPRNHQLRRHIKASHPTIEPPPVIPRKIGKKSKLWKEGMTV